MSSFKSKHQGHYQWSEVQALVRSFAERLRQRHKTDISSELTKDSLSGSMKTQKDTPPYSARQGSEFSPQKEIDLDSFRKAWQQKQERSINPQTDKPQETTDSIARVQHQAPQKESLTKTSKSQWDFEQNRLVPKSALSKVEHEDTSVSVDQSVNMPISNPWEMLRDHFIALRERRLALEKVSESQEDS